MIGIGKSKGQMLLGGEMKICINGFCGRMGQEILLASKKFDGAEVVFGVDTEERLATFPCNFENIKLVTNFDDVKCDVVIDFSHPKALKQVVDFCKKTKTALVVGTTGFGTSERNLLEDLSKIVPVFWSSNMSEGVFAMGKLVELATKILAGWDIEILETHHSAKVDLPSGTAIMLLDKIKRYRPHITTNLGRHTYGTRGSDEVGIHSIRAGGFCGTHKVLFANDSQSVEVSHIAFSKSVFAEGAMKASMFVYKKKCGMYDMEDMYKL